MFPIKPMVFEDSKYDYPSFFSYLNNFDFCELKMTEKYLNKWFESDDSTGLIRYSFGILSAIPSIHINHDWCHWSCCNIVLITWTSNNVDKLRVYRCGVFVWVDLWVSYSLSYQYNQLKIAQPNTQVDNPIEIILSYQKIAGNFNWPKLW